MPSSLPSKSAERTEAGAETGAGGLPTPDALHAQLVEIAQTHASTASRLIGAERLIARSGLGALLDLYRRYRNGPVRPIEPALLELLDIRWHLSQGTPDDIPASGPLLVLANHPTGAMEALILATLIDARRSDRRVLGNGHVAFVPELGARQIRIDPVGRQGNAPALVLACRHLRAGGCLMTFPAGTVAHWQWRTRRIAEAPWHPSVARIAMLTGASVLSINFEARASLLWRLASPFSRLARTALLPRELLAQRGARVGVGVGRLLKGQDEIDALFAQHGTLIRRETP